MRRKALYILGLAVFILISVGLLVLSSASEANGLRRGSAYYFLIRQCAYFAFGLIVAFVTARVDYRIWRNHPILVWSAGGIVFLLLVAVLFAPAVKGSHRWLSFGPLSLQPGELAKIMTVIATAVCVDLAGWRVELFKRGALYPAIVIGTLAGPVIMEPDFGSFMVIAMAGGLILWLAGTRIRHMLPFFALGVALFVVLLLHNPNRMARMRAFLEPDDAKSEETQPGALRQAGQATNSAAYQVEHSLAAIGRGGVWGVGLNASMQKHAYLPENHTDFIFAIGAEEMGLVFSCFVWLVFLVFFATALYISRHAIDRFGRLLAFGMSFLIFFQAMFNLGVVCDALPTKGMALPFFSYGGTNILVSSFAVGTIFSVGIQACRQRKREFITKVIL